MNKACVSAMVRWVQRSGLVTLDGKVFALEERALTFEEFFRVCMHRGWGYWNQDLLNYNVREFRRNGVVPAYVVVFLKQGLYPRFLAYERRVT